MLFPSGTAHSRILAAHGLLDLIEQRDLAQHFLGDGRAVALESLDEAAADMRPAIDRLPRAIVARGIRHRIVGSIGVALQEASPVSGQKVQRMRLRRILPIVNGEIQGG